MRKAYVVVLISLIIFPVSVDAGGKKKGHPKNVRIYAAKCTEVVGPVLEQLQARDFLVVEEDVTAEGKIEIELAREGGLGKESKARGWVELDQVSDRCTVIVTLQHRHPTTGVWQDIAWKENKFYAPIDEQFPRVE